SEAIAELGTDDLEKRFESLGEADDIDAELASMKNQLTAGNPSQLPSASLEVDPELEKLRSQIRGN
ncbi:MAG: PspA/IM30 family protein, partial [Phormidesmis sp. CAN_BIN44]|nr:PspA/IM30 family protein [Phormidesmis sp. CAN_BIN44]